MLIGITGATGFLGRYVVNHLLAAGHHCRCWFRPGSDRGGFLDAPGRLEWTPGGLNDEAANVALAMGADAVVHAALDWPRGSSLAQPGQLAQANILGTLALIRAAREAKVGRFVFISSCAVHDVILPDRPLDEAHPLWPKSHYGAHKAAIEAFVHSLGLGDGWAISALRPTGIYGLTRPASDSRWLPLVREVLAGRPINSAAGGKEVHAADVAKAIEVLLNAPESSVAGQSFNCYDRYIADQDVARLAARLSKSASPIATLNRGPKNQIDTAKIRSLGMSFGGEALLEKTVAELIDVVGRGG